VRRAFGNPQNRPSQPQVQQLTNDRQKEIEDLRRLEQQMQSAIRDLASTQHKASTKLRDALGEMQQQELPRDMQRNSDYIRRGYPEYAVMSEPGITQGMNNLRDRLKDVQQAMTAGENGKDAKGGQDDKALEQALARVEKLRQQMEQLSQRGQGQAGHQPGQQLSRQPGNQPGQQSGQQQGQPGGQQGQGGQQPGQQPGQQGQQGSAGGPGNQRGQNWQPGTLSRNQPGGPNLGNGGPDVWGPNGAFWYNNPNLSGQGVINPRDFQDNYQMTLQQLQALERQMQNDQTTARDLQELIKEMQRLNPWTYANDPELANRIQAAMLGDIQQVEMELRRKVEEANGGSVRSGGNAYVPPGYDKAVADYFKNLSKSK